jgi:hypothetical protein
LEFGEFQGQAHVPLDLDFALEERLLRVQFSGDQVDDVAVVHDEGDVGFYCNTINVALTP